MLRLWLLVYWFLVHPLVFAYKQVYYFDMQNGLSVLLVFFIPSLGCKYVMKSTGSDISSDSGYLYHSLANSFNWLWLFHINNASSLSSCGILEYVTHSFSVLSIELLLLTCLFLSLTVVFDCFLLFYLKSFEVFPFPPPPRVIAFWNPLEEDLCSVHLCCHHSLRW